ncbi:hypothetical protein FRZ67_15140 [Panacibacter ginsenosidivorans]|uniref:DUF2116 family Zn-ribbon domain-containing protein n=1 Tax=Panacibacter ginsenosidivorans TaxID=1813871 RepID=A0A5B8VD48_9BACT|nr:hypothetical protein [Panacibacter ginsenosidivorans]QEC68576.1 hypothetical protein FRZ67_15140 [Panacibacter ginsenosidivorans]
MEPATTRPCLACGKPVKGRIDKKFCDDYCRNVYNNQTKLDESTLVRQIINTLKKNRRILADFLGDKGITKVAKTKLLQAGFQFSYHTHQYVNQKGDIYFFCFEYGYLPLESDWYLLVKRKEEKKEQ